MGGYAHQEWHDSVMERSSSKFDGEMQKDLGMPPMAVPSRAFPIDTTDRLQALLDEYRSTTQPIPVSFRNLVPWIKVGERATHYLHSYPAKLLPHIAHFFLASQRFCPANGLVLDPFSGSGTVALEAFLSGRPAAYADTNPLARLITEAKLRVIPTPTLQAAFERVSARYLKSRVVQHPAVVNVHKWFQPAVIRSLARLRAAIEPESSADLQKLLQVTFSATVRRVSNADPRLSVPVLLKDDRVLLRSEDVWQCFADQFGANTRRIEQLTRLCPSPLRLTEAGGDARRMHVASGGRLGTDSVDLVLTSPPYAGAQKYIRASSLSLGWLGLAEAGQLKPLENATIGREHLPGVDVRIIGTSIPAANVVISRIWKRNPLRAAICATYLNEMEAVFEEVSKVTRPGGKLILVIGNNEVCGQEFMSSEYLCEMIERTGFQLELALIDEIKSRGLMTKRNRTASVITREWVMVFGKNRQC